ncbi:MAG: RNA polymerase sigma-70 factor [Cyclobacteriaceae bacterium]|nr:RNA polymerase sigma-70 factor [Cyclobacteriaceae bacterium]
MDKNYLHDLISRISLRSEEKAARELFHIFHPKLVRFAVFYVSSVHDANDIVSEVFIKFFRRLKKNHDIQDVSFYLYKSVKNQCLTHLKSQKKDFSIDDMDWDNVQYNYEIRDPESELINRELSSKIEEAINNLPQKRKLIYKMVVIDGLKYKEAAEILDLSVKTIENHLVLAVKDLRSKISAYLTSEGVDVTELNAYYKKNN